jgi:RNA polymerase sigma-70 factor (ECF subfamily)
MPLLAAVAGRILEASKPPLGVPNVVSETSASLLERLRDEPDGEAWRRLVAVYTPLLRQWLGRYGLQPSDVDDLTQEVLAVVVRELPGFEHNRRPGAFRRWLRTILVHRLRGFWRARQSRPVATGDSDLGHVLEQLEDPESGLSRLWDEEHDRHVMARLLEQIEPEVKPATWQAFRRVVLDGQDEESVAAALGLSVNAVFIAKSRVLARLRREARELLDS